MTWPCAWSDPCTPTGQPDTFMLDRPPHGVTQPGAPYETHHHHDHTACTQTPKGWRHPGDRPHVMHECGSYWVHARNPIERMWPPVTPWRVLATNIMSVRTRRARTIIAAQRLFDAGVTPERIGDITDETLAGIIEPVGLVDQRIVGLRAAADVCHRHTQPSVDQIAVINGVGPHIIDAYRVHVFGDVSGPPVNIPAHAWHAIHHPDRLA